MMRCGLRRVLSATLAAAGVVAVCCLVVSQNSAVDEARRHGLKWDMPAEDIRRYLKEAEAENALRLQTVSDTCRKHNLGLYRRSSQPTLIKHPPTPQYAVYYVDKAHKLSWCPIYKAASTTFLYNLLRLAGFPEGFLSTTKRQLSDVAREAYPELEFSEAEEALQSTLKLMVVRHPFERLLSAYRDKLENMQTGHEHGTLHYYRKYGQRMVRKYRRGGNSTKAWTLLRPDQYYWPPGRPRPTGVEPTFREFIRYLTDMDVVLYSDDHWIPYYLYCTPCLVKYDIVAKVETLLRDQVYMIHAARVQDLIQPRWEHRTAGDPGDISRRYFSQLTPSLVRKLHEKYQLDFELFGYNIDEYLDYANSD